MSGLNRNLDPAVVAGFGDEWTRFDQAELAGEEYGELFDSYFHIFPWQSLPKSAVGFDLGCGSGRWARGVATRVGTLHCIDASPEALSIARRNLAAFPNVQFHEASVDSIPMNASSMDFGYCLGVLHHVPDPEAGLAHAVSRLKGSAPFLLYMYYSFDNQPRWYRWLWQSTNIGRVLLSRAPHAVRYAGSQFIAGAVYFPLARAAATAERLGLNVQSFPLSAYRKQSFYTMRTDALDRFGTRLEKRFSRSEIVRMMERCGLTRIVFSERTPFWCALGYRR